MDKYFFTDYWQERNYEEFIALQQKLVNQEQWIIDGNSTKSFEMRYKRADICLYFNFPKTLCYWRVFKRLLYKEILIDDRADNCCERVSWSLLKYMWGFEKRVNPILDLLKQNYPDVRFIEIKSDRALKKLSLSLSARIKQALEQVQISHPTETVHAALHQDNFRTDYSTRAKEYEVIGHHYFESAIAIPKSFPVEQKQKEAFSLVVSFQLLS